MKLGLVCISELLREKSPELKFKTMTRTQFLKKDREESIQELSRRISHNLTVTIETIKHCKEIGIKHYRISCKLFPLITDPTLKLDLSLFPYFNVIEQKLIEIGRNAKELNISVSVHPDQFVVLGSESDDICANSIRELNFHAWVLDMMRMPQNHTCPINIHPSLSKFSSPEAFVRKFVINFFQCDIGVRNRLVIENEHHAFWNCNNLYEYFHNYMKNAYNFYLPLTLDNLHDKCNPSYDINNNKIPYEKHFIKFYQTWSVTPVFHWSESDDNSIKHAKKVINPPIDLGLDCIYEMEYKAKDKAFIHLLR